MASTAPARAQEMANAGLGGTDRQSGRARARPLADGLRFGAVVENRAGAMRIDVIKFSGVTPAWSHACFMTRSVVVPCGSGWVR